ncbi:MAG: iron-containing alcohol dehydrogenase [Bacteroidetes bacterium]|nr:iron-containing alcohol dehydrogenase [Bacteroidota bacterium]
MYYSSINIPIILEVANGAISNFDYLLKKNFLSFENRFIITEESLFNNYRNFIDRLNFSKVYFNKSYDFKDVIELAKDFNNDDFLIIGFGGGKILDFTKLFADKVNLPYIVVPSTLSNDGIYSPIARLDENGKKKSFGVKPPLGIIADLDIIKNSPEVNLIAGVGDLISNLSALKDWKYANKVKGELINDFAYSLSYMSASSIFKFSEKDIYTKKFLQALTYGLIMSGLSMMIAGNSRPASGSEHQLSHSIDEYFSQRATLHGIQVAWGFLLIEERFRENNTDELRMFFDNIGLNRLISERINFSDSEVNDIVEKAKKIRNRFTILNK